MPEDYTDWAGEKLMTIVLVGDSDNVSGWVVRGVIVPAADDADRGLSDIDFDAIRCRS